MTMIDRMTTAIDAELGKQEMVLTDPLTLRRLMAKRIARVALLAIRKPDVSTHNAGALSDHQSKPPALTVREDGLVAIDWRGADPSGIFSAMIDDILNEGVTDPDKPA